MLTIIAILIIGIAGYFSYGYVFNKAFQQGQSSIIQEQTITGNIYYFVNQSEGMVVKNTPIQEICGQG